MFYPEFLPDPPHFTLYLIYILPLFLSLKKKKGKMRQNICKIASEFVLRWTTYSWTVDLP